MDVQHTTGGVDVRDVEVEAHAQSVHGPGWRQDEDAVDTVATEEPPTPGRPVGRDLRRRERLVTAEEG
jgi:hypothetical protein